MQADEFEIGNFATIYDYCFFPGPGTLRIGHNFWLGTASIVDSQGGTRIGNNVGIGAHSQLWTHMTYGDTVYGCRFDSVKSLTLEDDVWLVGHCLLGPITAGERSLAMLGSVVTRDMEADKTYGGAPAQDLTGKIGPQFEIRPVAERRAMLGARLDQLVPDPDERRSIRVVDDAELDRLGDNPGVLVLNVESRTYAPIDHPWATRVLRGLLPRAKFVPADAQRPTDATHLTQ